MAYGDASNPALLRKGGNFAQYITLTDAEGTAVSLTGRTARAELRTPTGTLAATMVATVHPTTAGRVDVTLAGGESETGGAQELAVGMYRFDVECPLTADADDIEKSDIYYVRVLDEITTA